MPKANDETVWCLRNWRVSLPVMFRKRLRIIDNSSECKMRHVSGVGVAKSSKIVEELAVDGLRVFKYRDKERCVTLSENYRMNSEN